MKTFRGWLNEVSAQKATKDFETYIANLAVLSNKETNPSKLKKMVSENSDKFGGIRPKDISQVVDSVSKLNKFFSGKVWTKGINANFERGLHKGIYGKRSEAKADIILTSGGTKYGISIKKKGDIVVASSQDPDEFENIFWSALKKCKDDNKIDMSTNESWSKVIGEVENAVINMRDNVIGQTKSRILSPDWFNKLKAGKKNETPEEQQKRKQFFDDFEKFIEEQNKTISEDYEETRTVIAKEGAKIINEKLGQNDTLREYVIWEALSAILKYEGKLPAATHILSPDGCHDISNPNSNYVKKVAKVANINIRGMVHGAMRSGKESAMKPIVKKLFAGETIDMASLYDDMRGMDMSMKIDLKAKDMQQLDNHFSMMHGQELSEGIISNIIDKIKGLWNSFKSKIMSKIESMKEAVSNVLNIFSKMKSATLLDIIKFNKPKVSGSIKIP